MTQPSLAQLERFIKKFTLTESGCLEWQGATDFGYGRTSLAGRRAYTHRIMYENVVAPVPRGLVLDHLCRNRLCANIKHLEVVTQRVNTVRGVGPASINFNRKHCVNGHPFTEANTYWHKRSTGLLRRQCIKCARRRTKEYLIRKKENDRAIQKLQEGHRTTIQHCDYTTEKKPQDA